MKKISLALAFAVLLSGCATQFGTRIPHTIQHKAPVVAHAPAPVAVPPPVVVAPPAAPVVAPKQTFKQRWLSKFFRKRAIEK